MCMCFQLEQAADPHRPKPPPPPRGPSADVALARLALEATAVARRAPAEAFDAAGWSAAALAARCAADLSARLDALQAAVAAAAGGGAPAAAAEEVMVRAGGAQGLVSCACRVYAMDR